MSTDAAEPDETSATDDVKARGLEPKTDGLDVPGEASVPAAAARLDKISAPTDADAPGKVPASAEVEAPDVASASVHPSSILDTEGVSKVGESGVAVAELHPSAASAPAATPDELYLDALLGLREDTRLEFKAAVGAYSADKAISYCAALANEGGGYLILGVSDKAPRVVNGTAAFRNPQELELRIFEKLAIKVPIRELTYQTKRVVVFQIPTRMKGVPIAHDGRFLMRAGESLVAMTTHQIGAIFAEHQGPFEARHVREGVSQDEVNRLLDLDAYFRLMPDADPVDLPLRLSVLKERRLIADAGGDRYDITNSGALFLARSLDDFPALSMRRVRVIRYAGTDRVNAVFEHFETRGYGPAFEPLLELITANIPAIEVIEGGLRSTMQAYAPRALREFLANALIHQDLEEAGVQIAVEIFENRLEIRSPGRPLIEVQRFVDETRARNPDLAEIMRLARICEVRGSGIDRAIEQIEDFMQPAPRFQAETAATRVTLVSHLKFEEMTQEERIWSAYLHCCVKYERSDRLTNASLRARHGLPTSKTPVVSQTITAAVEVGLIKLDPRVGSSRRHAAYVPFFG
ncbi:ATP-binding protein [Curtobacterium flaccumfaciens]|uniref:ATP-binding protein n=1 Tax=Curtobacterium flaccumfaciens TaxID=2035 RepID=UPI003D9A5A54